MKKFFVLYDSIARDGDTDSASVYATAMSEKEAMELGKDPAWDDGIWYEYDTEQAKKPNFKGELIITNGRPRWDILPNKIQSPWGNVETDKPKYKCKIDIDCNTVRRRFAEFHPEGFWCGMVSVYQRYGFDANKWGHPEVSWGSGGMDHNLSNLDSVESFANALSEALKIARVWDGDYGKDIVDGGDK